MCLRCATWVPARFPHAMNHGRADIGERARCDGNEGKASRAAHRVTLEFAAPAGTVREEPATVTGASRRVSLSAAFHFLGQLAHSFLYRRLWIPGRTPPLHSDSRAATSDHIQLVPICLRALTTSPSTRCDLERAWELKFTCGDLLAHNPLLDARILV